MLPLSFDGHLFDQLEMPSPTITIFLVEKAPNTILRGNDTLFVVSSSDFFQNTC